MAKSTLLKYCIVRAKSECDAAARERDPGIAEAHRAMATCFKAMILEVKAHGLATRH
ncbi:MAG: hypothetical protein JWO15_2131 [Sphingomonadales bacterium]|nr:hypothetical protein [Sphingomonadales bacterium]